jgi:hypothetical protein
VLDFTRNTPQLKEPCVKRRTFIVLGLVVSTALCAAPTIYLIAVGARTTTQVTPLSPTQTYLTGGGLFIGVLGLAVCLGLALRRTDAAVADDPTEPTPQD